MVPFWSDLGGLAFGEVCWLLGCHGVLDTVIEIKVKSVRASFKPQKEVLAFKCWFLKLFR
jgi:hypothetical protein